MKNQLLRRLSAFCTGAAMSLSSLMIAGMSAPITASAASGSDDYAKLLQYSMYLYDANMCGNAVESTSGLGWRGNCHTTDEVVGGFHDAGDHAMFGLPQGYSASTLGWGYYEFKDAYNATGQAEHLKTITDYFCDFFKRSTVLSGDSVSRFLYQKEDGDVDHGYWGPPEKQNGTRKMFWTTGGASDIAAEYAAALALNYINFGNAEDLKYAEALYKFSTQHNQVATDGPNTFYKSSGCTDEQAWAAGWLYLATQNESYKSDCASKQTQYLGWVHGWDNVGLGAACVYAHITGSWNKVNDYIGSCANGSGYFFMDKWGSARLNTTMQFCALVASKNSNADFTTWAKGQMDYITGNNPSGYNFVVGFSSNSAKNPHHRAASGYYSYDEMGETTVSGPNAHSLIGALVGGPTDAGGSYVDSISDYVCNEVAIDYNAGFVGACAGLYETYKTGKTVSSIEGVSKIYNGSVTTPGGTTAPPAQTTPPTSTSKGVYEVKLNQDVDYTALPKDDKMIGWDWADFDIPYGEKATKVEINISAKDKIGKWEGAFGSSTTVAPDYWTQTGDMSETINGNSGTVTWEIPAADAATLGYYNGQLKFGIWWIDCQQFTIDSIKVYTDAAGSSSAGTTTNAPAGTTGITTTTTAKTTAPSASSGNGEYNVKVGDSYNYNTMDEKMIGFSWADFGIGANEKVKKVEVKISSNGNIGKWEGAFGTSTSVAPDYWTQSADMSQNISGNSGVITWNVDKATADIIQYNYGGELKFGVWWIDCGQFTIDSITVYTDGTGTAQTTTTTASSSSTTTTTTNNPNTGSSRWGDANVSGSIDVADAVLIARYCAGDTAARLTDQGIANADVNHNGNVDPEDVAKILQYVAKLISYSDLER